ncbi:hypothetical protein AGMMS50256_36540 [Betaproteobacteria bacterium]|nr:hypothetical protein AGMMS50256_36540 [Betaproteobacteria bacterium]
MKLTNNLTDERIRAAKPADKPVRMYDGGGLYLEISPAGGKLWRLKYRFGGMEKRLALGKYPAISLEDARERRDEAKELLANSVDPSTNAKEERAKARDERARQKAATRFMLDNEGALSFKLGTRSLYLTPAETGELRIFLEATKEVTPCL